MEFPEDWYEDIDGRNQMLSQEKVGAEIERLRADFAQQLDLCNEAVKQIERLRAALKEIAGMTMDEPMRGVARRALGQG